MTTTNPIHTLRGILRLVKTPPLPKGILRKQGTTTPPRLNAAQTFILQQYRESKTIEMNTGGGAGSAGMEDKHKQRRQQQLLQTIATNYYQLQKDIHERSKLYELDTGAEVVLTPKESSRRAAARAGLQLPKLYPELQHQLPIPDGDDEEK